MERKYYKCSILYTNGLLSICYLRSKKKKKNLKRILYLEMRITLAINIENSCIAYKGTTYSKYFIYLP